MFISLSMSNCCGRSLEMKEIRANLLMATYLVVFVGYYQLQTLNVVLFCFILSDRIKWVAA